MKIFSKITKNLNIIFFLFISLLVFFFQGNFQIIKALPMDSFNSELIVEELRLKVPSDFKEVWIKAENQVWEPWLSIQKGFLGRQIFWDRQKEEALILVKWENKKLWKSISMQEVEEVQRKFEDNVKAALNVGKNPFELIYEGELNKQG